MSETIAAQPFLKWAGGKGQLLSQFEAFFPTHPGENYFEPFAGSGAVFFHLRNRGLFSKYHLFDINEELINCYIVVRDNVDDLITQLAEHKAKNNKEYYYNVRERDRKRSWKKAGTVERAARMIYLNKTCYNGLWRVNSKGHFNVPVGRYVNPDILNEKRLRAASMALENVEIAVKDFTFVQDVAKKNDFVYFDPPYHPLSETSNFTSYSPDSFGPENQEELAKVFSTLAERGCEVMLSNSDTLFIRKIYGKMRGIRIETVEARRAINSARNKRGLITEVVILSY